MYIHRPKQFPQSPSGEIIDPEPRPVETNRDQTKPDHSRPLCRPFSSHTDRQTRPTSLSRTTRPNQCQSVRPTDQTRPPSLSPPISLTFSQHAQPAEETANEPLFLQVRSIHYGLGQGRLIHKALVGPCKAYYPHTFGLKSLDFYSRL